MSETNFTESPDLEERFCFHCGRSLVPLRVFHAERPCTKCPRKVYVEGVKDEQGSLRFAKGDRLIIPEITISLDPRKHKGEWFYYGLQMFVQMMFAANQPSIDDLNNLFDYYVREGEGLLRRSPLLQGLDFDSERDREKVEERVFENKESQEFAAGLMMSAAGTVKEALSRLESSEGAQANAKDLVWHTYMATLGYALYLIKDEHFAKTLWHGQRAYKFLLEVEDTAAQTPAEVEALEKLKPLFERQSEETLHTWLEDGRPIASRLNVNGIPEETLRAQCKYHYDQFERRRQEERQRQEDKRKDRDLKLKYIGLGLTIGTAACSGLWAVLKYVFEVL